MATPYDSETAVKGFLSRLRPRKDVDEGVRTNNAQADLANDTSATADDSSSDITSLVPVPGNQPPGLTEDAVYVAGARLDSYTKNDPLTTSATNDTPSRTLQDSMYATRSSARSPANARHNSKNMLDHDPVSTPMTPTQIELMKIKTKQPTSVPMETTVAAVEPAAFYPDGSVTGVPGSPDPLPNDAIQSYGPDESFISIIVEDSQVVPVSPAETPASSPMAADFKPAVSVSSPTISSSHITAEREQSSDAHDADIKGLKEASDILAGKIAVVQLDTKAQQDAKTTHKAVTEGENREHATYFSAWGTPEGRNKPKSRTRKIILSGLPSNADHTFVQALVHGGTLESIKLSPSGNTAYVLFTSGEACDYYADKYSNGIFIKHKGRSLTMFVDKAKEVDVVSSMLEAYLGAGASRVVRATNADEDWSMRALHRIAEGDNKRRKVESITDELRNETRTIIFRFANIADAVAFRSNLKRDPEWEAAEIQFVADPCEKATGFHFE